MVGVLALCLADQSHRQVPAFWQSGLKPGGDGHFVIREEGDLTLKFVAARLGAGNLEIVPVPSSADHGARTRSVAELARRFSVETKRPVLAAVNGGFFDLATGLPIGFLLREGQMEFFNMPQGFQRSMVGFCSPGLPGEGARVWISTPEKMPKVWLDTFRAGSGGPTRTASLAVHHVNVPGGKHAFSLFTPHYKAALGFPQNSLYAIAQAEPGRLGIFRVQELKSQGRVRIPKGGLVIALHGDARAHARGLSPGTLIRPRWSLPPEWQEHQVSHGLLAGPRLLRQGRVQVTAKEERLEALKSRDRVALGVKPDGEAIFLWAHKNTPGNLSFERVAGVLSGMGAIEAIGLDGGRSRAILAEMRRGYSEDRYFDGGRPVANALVLADHPPSTN
jgi:hypothetical protein